MMAGGKREKEVHTGTGVIVGSLLRPVPLNPTMLIQELSRKDAVGATWSLTRVKHRLIFTSYFKSLSQKKSGKRWTSFHTFLGQPF